jgi:hypothetical protein
MPKIKCPHCGANNQDVTEKDRCWQCDAVLGDPPVVAEPPAEAAPPASAVQKQVEPLAPVSRPSDATPQRRFPAVPIAIAVFLILLLVILYVVLKK